MFSNGNTLVILQALGILNKIKMTKENRTKRLREIMAGHNLNAPDVGELLKRSPQTVRSWACANDQRAIPPHMLELLESKLGISGADSEQA
jgi:hypothetical protein